MMKWGMNEKRKPEARTSGRTVHLTLTGSVSVSRNVGALKKGYEIMRLVTCIVVAMLTVLINVSPAQETKEGQEPKKLSELRQQFESRKQKAIEMAERPILIDYKNALEGLQNALTEKKDLVGALAVRSEKEKILAELSPTKQDTYISEQVGSAGYPQNTYENLRKFDIKNPGKKTILKLWIVGADGNDTGGDVQLISGDVKNTVYTWSGKSFPKVIQGPYNKQSFRKVKPIECDISEWVQKPGEYSVNFQYTGGYNPLAILRVAIECR